MPEKKNKPKDGTVLFIDDEENVLTALRRQLRREYDVLTAVGGEEGVKAVEHNDDIAVVVCDMRMPGLDGVETLEKIDRLAPDTVRMMLTGNADQETAVAAVNRGHIFRFLNKPCPEEDLRHALDDALRQHQLITAEKTLLQHTLAGSVKVLMDVLSIVDPQAFGDSSRMRGWVRDLAKKMKLPHPWEVEIAVTLSPIGLVSVPAEILEKYHQGAALTETEEKILAASAGTARRLISNIPRLNGVAEAVYFQNKHYDGSGYPHDELVSGEGIPQAARIIAVLKALAMHTKKGSPSPEDVAALQAESGRYDPGILMVLADIWQGDGQVEVAADVREISIELLLTGDILHSDIMMDNGSLLLSAGNAVTQAQLERIQNLQKIGKISEVVRIERPLKGA